MMQRRFALLCLAFVSIPVVAQETKKPAAIVLRVEKEDAIYAVGQKAKFVFQIPESGEIQFAFTEDGYKPIRTGKLPVEANKFYSLSEGLDHPGFLRLTLQFKTQSALAAAAFDPTKIKPASPAPADFDEFWQQQIAKLKETPIDPKLDPWTDHKGDKFDAFKISLGLEGERRVFGYLTVPKGDGPFPAILTVPYAGVYTIAPDKNLARHAVITMHIVIHDFPVDLSKEELAKKKKELEEYRRIGWDDREKSYFRLAILAGYRAADYLASRSDFNGNLAVQGGSQGGGLSLCVAGLHPGVKLVASNVAALCDHGGERAQRVSGWPNWVKGAPAELKAKVQETAGYFDAVHFASRFKGKSLLGVGFIDTVCPPTSVYAAFNQLPDPKAMIASPLLGHGTDVRFTKATEALWKKHLNLK